MASNESINTLENHNECLNNMCRICSNRAQTFQQINQKVTPRFCKSSTDEIFIYYGIDISSDNEHHPTKICNHCFMKMKNAKVLDDNETQIDNEKYLGEKEKARLVSELWKPHKRISCEVCKLYTEQKAKGRQKKMHKRGRPKKKAYSFTAKDNAFSSLFETNSVYNDPLNNSDIEVQNMPSELVSTYISHICQGLYSLDSVKTICDHYFCSSCLLAYFKHKEDETVSCPICSKSIKYGDVKNVDERFKTQMMNLEIKCLKCGHVGPLVTVQLHICDVTASVEASCITNEISTSSISFTDNGTSNNVTSNLHSTPVSSNKYTGKVEIEIQTSPISKIDSPNESLTKTLQRSITSPLSKKEERVHTHLLKRKLKFATEKSIIKCKTGGQPIIMKRLTNSRKSTDNVKSPLKRKRAKEMADCRTVVAGNNAESQHQQQTSELKSLTKRSRLQVCSKAGVKHKTYLSRKVALAMKTSLGLSWNQHRQQKRFLTRHMGVECDSEKKERDERKEILSQHLQSKVITVKEKNDKDHESLGGFIERKSTVVHISDLCKFVQELLDSYSKCKQLIWKDGMPENEIWLKIGGDHGGNTFKLCLQVCNLERPNAKENTIVFSCVAAKDIHTNLEKIAEIHREQIIDLQQEYWKNKRIKVFMFGDYAFLAALYGISGARGTYFCLWCHIKNEDLQIPLYVRGYSTTRKYNNLMADYEKFSNEGRGKLSVASSYHNVIHAPLWDVKITHVCPPYLHILLGLVKRHHDLLEEELHQLDLQIADDVALTNVPLGDTIFHKYICSKREYRKTLNLLGYLQDIRDNDASTLKEKEKVELNSRIKSLQSKLPKQKPALSLQSGPIVSAVQVVLKRHNIVQQAYHSRSFVGNHCSKYIKENVQDDIRVCIQEKVCELSGKSDLNMKAKQLSEKFEKLNSLFSTVHTSIGHMNQIVEENIPEISSNIKAYLKFYRKCFPNSLLPKHHFLEDHTIPWIRKWGFGMALHGEQGGESIHREFNRIERNMCHVANPSQNLLYVMKEHHTMTNPKVQINVTKARKRNTKKLK